MVLGDRLKAIRESKEMSQGDIEKRTGLIRCYVSRVENGHTVPSVSTLEKWARAMEVPTYQLFHDGSESSGPACPLVMPQSKHKNLSPKDARILNRLAGFLARMNDRDKRLLVTMALKLSSRG
jgi:transcriptional regulator with XRE-family HTH domain